VVRIIAYDNAQQAHTVEASEGVSLMEALSASSVDFDGSCGGSLACASCHVWVGQDWIDRLPPASEAEEDMLDTAFNVKATSRLSCQIIIGPALEGLTVHLPGN